MSACVIRTAIKKIHTGSPRKLQAIWYQRNIMHEVKQTSSELGRSQPTEPSRFYYWRSPLCRPCHVQTGRSAFYFASVNPSTTLPRSVLFYDLPRHLPSSNKIYLKSKTKSEKHHWLTNKNAFLGDTTARGNLRILASAMVFKHVTSW